MKLKFVYIALAGLLISSCAGNGPENVVKEFLTAIENKNYDKAKSLATEDSKSAIDLVNNSITSTISSLFGNDEKKTVEKVDCLTEENKAECNCTYSNGETTKVFALKKDDKWLVDYTMNASDLINSLKNMDIDETLEQVDKGLEKLDKMSDEANKTINELKEQGEKVMEATDKAIEKMNKEVKEVEKALTE